MSESLSNLLESLYDAERESRRLHDQLAATAGSRHGALLKTLHEAIAASEALEPGEGSLRLLCLARLLGELEGDAVADGLIDILASQHPDARHEAGEQLQGLAYDRFKEVALAVERALKRLPDGSPALLELPYLLVEIPEGGVSKLLGMFLKHSDGEAVAAAIEALVELGDENAANMIRPLLEDGRRIVLESDDDTLEDSSTVGELALDALQLLDDEVGE